MSAPQAHDSNASRDNVAERPNMSMLTQLEAAAQVHDAGHGFEPPMHGELRLPLLPGEPAIPSRLGGRQPEPSLQHGSRMAAFMAPTVPRCGTCTLGGPTAEGTAA